MEGNGTEGKRREERGERKGEGKEINRKGRTTEEKEKNGKGKKDKRWDLATGKFRPEKKSRPTPAHFFGAARSHLEIRKIEKPRFLSKTGSFSVNCPFFPFFFVSG